MGIILFALLVGIIFVVMPLGLIIYNLISSNKESKMKADLKHAFYQTDHRYDSAILYRYTAIYKSYYKYVLNLIFSLIIILILVYFVCDGISRTI